MNMLPNKVPILLSLNVISILMLCRLQQARYVCHTLGCHFCTISTSKQRYLLDQIVTTYATRTEVTDFAQPHDK